MRCIYIYSPKDDTGNDLKGSNIVPPFMPAENKQGRQVTKQRAINTKLNKFEYE